jgi:Spondin_N
MEVNMAHLKPYESSSTVVKITIENLAPTGGTFLAKVWFGFHDGSFSIYELGAAASPALERLAEDGNTGPLTKEFSNSNAGLVQGTLFGPDGLFDDTAPGNKASISVILDGPAQRNAYFSYAAMIVPSNDAFIANGNPQAHKVFDDQGNFCGADIIVTGGDVLDAGTEVNDEGPFHAAGTGPIIPGVGSPLLIPGAGIAENGVVQKHTGYKLGGFVLSNPVFANADFTAPGYQIARITVEESRT